MNSNEKDLAIVYDKLTAIESKLDEMAEKVNQLHEVVTTLLGGIAQAQQSGGMAGMMARQFPDMSAGMNVLRGV